MDDLIECEIVKWIQDYSLSEATFLLAISGGIDSMVLAHVFKKLNFSFAIAHCNFSLRDIASDEDEQFVIDWAKKNEIPCFTKKFSSQLFSQQNADRRDANHPQSVGRGENIQNLARTLRYGFFKEVQNLFPYHYLVTAHHLNDQAETFFLHALRGSSTKGLLGMTVLKNNIFRPFIKRSKAELVSYSEKNQISFRQDQSNFSNKYKRNFLRNVILPPLIGYQNNTLKMLEKTMLFLAEDQQFLDSQIAPIWQKMHEIKSDHTLIFLENWNAEKEYVFRKKGNQIFGMNLPTLYNICRGIKEEKSGLKFSSLNFNFVLKKHFLIIQKK